MGISSQEVQNIIAAQQQALSMSSQYATQSSMGIGSYGSPHMGGGGMPQSRYLPHQQAGFNYGNPSHFQGYGMSNQVGAMAMSGMAGGFQAANTAIGIGGMAAGLGYAPGFLKPFVAGAAGMGLGLGAMAGGYAFGQMAQGAQENHMVYNTLNQFQFGNQGSRTGRGFDRNGAKAIADFTRQLQSVPEMMTSMSELNRIMNSLGQMGQFHGANEAHQFNQRFKEKIETLKSMAQVMQTSMEGALKFFQESRQAGFYSSGNIQHNSMMRQVTGAMTGMNQDQVNQLQQMGSQYNFAMGGYKSSGANLALRTGRMIGAANQMGVINNNQIMELTGAEGAEGIGILSQQLTGAAYKMMNRGPMARLLPAAIGKLDKDGKFTGEMDQEFVERMRSGDVSTSELKKRAHANTRGRGAKMSFVRQENKLRSEATASLGVEGVAMQLKSILGEHGYKNPDAIQIVMQRFGLDEREAESVMKVMENMDEIKYQSGVQGQGEARRIAEQSFYASNLSGDAIKTKMKKRWENMVEEPLKQMGANVSHAVESYIDNFLDDVMKRHKIRISKEGANLVSGAMSGDTSAQQRVKSDIAAIKASGMDAASVSSDMTYGLTQAAISMGTGDMSDEQAMKVAIDAGGSRYSHDRRRAGDRAYGREGSHMLGGGLMAAGAGVAMLGGVLPGALMYGAGLAAGTSDRTFQSGGERASMLNDYAALGKGQYKGNVSGYLKDDEGRVNDMAKSMKEIYAENYDELTGSSMTESKKYAMIKEQLERRHGGQVGAATRNAEKFGMNEAELIAALQERAGLGGREGTVNFGQMSKEMGNSFAAAFTNAEKIHDIQSKQAKDLSSKFKKGSEVEALLSGDSKAKALFVKATSGDAEARRLLTGGILDDAERSKLLEKYGISEEDLKGLKSMYASGAASSPGDIEHASKQFELGMRMGDYSGIATRLRRQGIDIADRASGLSGGGKDAVSAFARSLQGIDTLDKLDGFLSGGKGASGIMDTVAGLHGDDQKAALKALGPAASTAMSAAARYRKTGEFSKSLMEDRQIKEFVDGHGGEKGAKGLKGDDREKLAKMIRDKTAAAGFTGQGGMEAQKSQTEFVKQVDMLAKTTHSFAQMIIDLGGQSGNAGLKKISDALAINFKGPGK